MVPWQDLQAVNQDLLTSSYYIEIGGKELRYYQQLAVNRTIKVLARGQKRCLLVMDTDIDWLGSSSMVQPATAENGWVNTIDSKNPEILTKARGIIENNLYCVLSTSSPDGYPWVSPVFFACDESWSIYWCSAVASRHSQNIYSNSGRVAIAIFDSGVPVGTGKGVYFHGSASEIGTDLAEKAFRLLGNRTGKQPGKQPKTTAEDYLNSSPRRIYQFRPHQAWVSGERLAVGNQLLDTKIQINLQDL